MSNKPKVGMWCFYKPCFSIGDNLKYLVRRVNGIYYNIIEVCSIDNANVNTVVPIHYMVFLSDNQMITFLKQNPKYKLYPN